MLDAAKLLLGFDTNAGKRKHIFRFELEKINFFLSCMTWDGCGLRQGDQKVTRKLMCDSVSPLKLSCLGVIS